MKRTGGDEGSSDEVGDLFEVDLDEADKRVGIGGERIAANAIFGGGLHDGWLEGEEVLFSESCGHGVSIAGESEGGLSEAGWTKVLLE